MISALILEEIMWKSRLKCGLLCKNEIVTIFLLVFFFTSKLYLLRKTRLVFSLSSFHISKFLYSGSTTFLSSYYEFNLTPYLCIKWVNLDMYTYIYIYIPYLREYKAYLFQPNIAFKIGVRIRFEGALDSSTNSNNIQLYRFLRNNV